MKGVFREAPTPQTPASPPRPPSQASATRD
jgi:hypothetical protein